MSSIEARLSKIRSQIEAGVQLIAVSKTQPNEHVLEAYQAGQRTFGENYVQEFVSKQPLLPTDIEWHFIGHLQSNKVKFIAPIVSWIHSVDSSKLLSEINKQAAKNNRVVNCLLQVHVAMEETKFGWDSKELIEFVNTLDLANYSNVSIRGVMGMASFSNDEQLVRSEFKQIKTCFDQLQATAFHDKADFNEISMGMSGDWNWAVEEGSTMVRIGSAIFGARK